MNHITMQLEAPPEQHWRHVVARMQLTDLQLLQLAAAYQTFVQLRKVHQTTQLSIANLVSCEQTCSLQVLAAASLSGVSVATGAGGAAGAAAPGSGCSTSDTCVGASQAAQQAPLLSPGPAAAAEGHLGGPSLPAAAASAGDVADADAAGAAAAAAAMEDLHVDPLKLVNQLLGILNTSTIAIHVLLFNTLTCRQLALVSASVGRALAGLGLLLASFA
jgi:hypothetical protein